MYLGQQPTHASVLTKQPRSGAPVLAARHRGPIAPRPCPRPESGVSDRDLGDRTQGRDFRWGPEAGHARLASPELPMACCWRDPVSSEWGIPGLGSTAIAMRETSRNPDPRMGDPRPMGVWPPGPSERRIFLIAKHRETRLCGCRFRWLFGYGRVSRVGGYVIVRVSRLAHALRCTA